MASSNHVDMPEPFSAVQLLRYLGARWLVFVAAAASAALLAFVGSQFMTKQYTAQVRLLIEPPTGADTRSALVVSPVYLDSLRTFEIMASSAELFDEVAGGLQLQPPGASSGFTAWRESILDVEVVRNTKVLVIRATLPDASQAQALAEGLAEALVDRNQEVQAAGDALRFASASKARAFAEEQVRVAEQKLQEAAGKAPAAGLEAEVDALVTTREGLRAELRFLEERQRETGSDGDGKRFADRGARVRAQVETLDREIRSKQIGLSRAEARETSLIASRDAAQTVLQEAESLWLRETAGASSRGERLQIIDRGVMPDRPSSPRVALIVLVASVLALLASVFVVTLRFGLGEWSAVED